MSEDAPLAWPEAVPTLTDGVVTLRPWRADDADAVFRACQDPAIQRWTRVPVPYERAHADGFVTGLTAEQWHAHSGAHFAVVDDEDRVVASHGLVTILEPDLVAEIGYWVAPWARRRGVGSRAAALVADWAFAIGFERLELFIEPENAGSRGVADAIGAQFEGVLRSRALHRGERRDVAVYAVLP